jgi:hypothetical protein
VNSCRQRDREHIKAARGKRGGTRRISEMSSQIIPLKGRTDFQEVSNGAIPLQYIHSRIRADYIFRGAPFFGSLLRHGEQPPLLVLFYNVPNRGASRAWSKIIESNGTIQPISWLY